MTLQKGLGKGIAVPLIAAAMVASGASAAHVPNPPSHPSDAGALKLLDVTPEPVASYRVLVLTLVPSCRNGSSLSDNVPIVGDASGRYVRLS